MSKMYPPAYERLYSGLSRSTGMSKDEIDIVILKMVKLFTDDLNHKGKVTVPYLGKFYLKRMPPRERSVADFVSDERYTVQIPAQDKLKFEVNKQFRRIFK